LKLINQLEANLEIKLPPHKNASTGCTAST